MLLRLRLAAVLLLPLASAWAAEQLPRTDAPPPRVADQPSLPDRTCYGEIFKCRREILQLGAQIEPLERSRQERERDKARRTEESARIKREIAELEESHLKPVRMLEQQLGSCVNELRRDAAKVGAKVVTDEDGRVIGIGPARGPSDELTQARLKTLGRAMDLCNRLHDRLTAQRAKAGPHEARLRDLHAKALTGQASSFFDTYFEVRREELERSLAERRQYCALLQKRCVGDLLAVPDASVLPPEPVTPDLATIMRPPAPAEGGREPRTSAAPTFSGVWQSSEGRMVLGPVNDGRIQGKYENDDGRVFLNMRGDILAGYWVEKDSEQRCPTQRDGSFHWGRIELTFDAARTKFEGHWTYCDTTQRAGSWSGRRP